MKKTKKEIEEIDEEGKRILEEIEEEEKEDEYLFTTSDDKKQIIIKKLGKKDRYFIVTIFTPKGLGKLQIFANKKDDEKADKLYSLIVRQILKIDRIIRVTRLLSSFGIKISNKEVFKKTSPLGIREEIILQQLNEWNYKNITSEELAKRIVNFFDPITPITMWRILG